MNSSPATPTLGRLLPLAPHAPNRAFVESFTSFLIRLASAHFLPVWYLVTRELIPAFRRRSLVDGRGQCDFFGPTGAALNGIGTLAGEAIDVLKELTQRPSLERLTLQPLQYLISARSSVVALRRWCPICLSEWRRHGEPGRELLIWQLEPVQVCPWHPLTKLNFQCPHCERQQQPLVHNSQIGICNHCCGWLGIQRPESISGTGAEQRVAIEALEFMDAVWSGRLTPSLSVFQDNLRWMHKHFFSGNLLALARSAGLHHSSMADLAYKGAKPGLNTVFQLALGNDLSAIDLVAVSLAGSSAGVAQRRAKLAVPRKHCCRYDWIAVEKELARLSHASSTGETTESFNDFCRSRNLDSGSLLSR